MNMRQFLKAVWPPSGHYCVATPFTPPGAKKPTYAHKVFNTINEVVQFAEWKRDTIDLYFAVHTLKEPFTLDMSRTNYKTGQPGAKEYRTHANMAEGRVFFFDLDVGDPTTSAFKYATQGDALAALQSFVFNTCLPDPLVVSSGGGVHVYWRLPTPIPSAEWRGYAKQLHHVAQSLALRVDPSRTADQSSVLRIVGTFNLKKGQKRPVVILHEGEETPNADFLAQLQKLSKEYHGPLPRHAHPAAGQPDADPGALGSNLGPLPYDGPKVTGEQVIEACSVLKSFADAQGNVDEPLWYGSLGAFAYVVDGLEVCQRLSSGHPDYNPEDTERKVEQFKSKAAGPTSCEKLASLFGGIDCQSCPNKHLGKNPLVIAHKLQQLVAAPAPVIAPTVATITQLIEPPHPYKRVVAGIVMTGRDDTGQLHHEIIVPYDLFPYEAYDSTENESGFSNWCVNLPHVGQRTFKVLNTCLYDKKQLHLLLMDRGIYLASKYIGKVLDYMVAYIRALRDAQAARIQFDHLGWTEGHKHFVIGGRFLDEAGAEHTCTLSQQSRNAEAFMTHVGTLQDQVRAMEFYNKPEYLPHQYMICSGIGAPMFYTTGQGGVILNASGDSGASKSTALNAIGSLWGHPYKYVINGTEGGATKNFRMEQAVTLANLPVCVDEITQMDPDEAREMALGVSQRTGRSWMTQTRQMRTTRAFLKATVMITSGNSSLHQLINANTISGIAGSMRVLEMYIEKADRRLKPLADQFMRDLVENHGHIGPEYMRRIIPIREKMEELGQKAMASVDKQFDMDTSERFHSAQISNALVNGQMAYNMGLLPFKIEPIKEWLAQVQIPYMRGIIKAEVEAQSSLSVLTNYLEAIHGNMIMTNSDISGNIDNPIEIIRGPLAAHFDMTARVIYARRDHFREWCERRGHNFVRVIAEMRNDGVITHADVKRTLGGSTSYAKARVACFEVNLKHPLVAATNLPGAPVRNNVTPLNVVTKPKQKADQS